MTASGGMVPDHFPGEGRSLPREGQLHQKGPYLGLPEKGQNVLSGAVIVYRISEFVTPNQQTV